jgi:hypothetical protein
MKGDELQPVGADPRHHHGAERDAGREADDDRQHPPPYRRQRFAVHPQNVGVEHHLDRHERRVEHPVGHEQQRDRYGDRREPVAERAVHDRGAERDGHERDELIRHETAPGKAKSPVRLVPPPGFDSFSF